MPDTPITWSTTRHWLHARARARRAHHRPPGGTPRQTICRPPAWQAHLERLGITALTVTPDPVQIATEGALWGSIQSHDFLRDTVIVSDDAGQFAVGLHALCWIHAERLVHKLDTFTDHQRAAQQQVRSLIWQFYADLKDYCRTPTPWQRAHLACRFDYIFRRRTGFVTLDRLLQRLHANKAELLTALDHPDIPLHTNTARRTISAAKSPNAKSVAVPAAMSVATAAMPSLAWPRPAPSWASLSGTTSAADLPSPISRSFRPCQTSSVPRPTRLSHPIGRRPGNCPNYVMCYTDAGQQRRALLLRGGAHWDVRLEETPHLVDRALSQFLRLLPRIDRDLGVRRQ